MRTITIAVIAACLAVSAFAQATLSPVPMIQFFDASSGVALPCVGCTLSTFIAGTSTPAHTYVDSAGVTQNPVVITLNSIGQTTSGVWLPASCFKFVLANAASSVIWSQDQVCGASSAGSSATFSALTVTGNAAVGGTLTVTGATTLGTVAATNVTTTAVTGYEISPIFNCYVVGLSGSANCFQNSDGSFTMDYTGAGAMQNLAVQRNVTIGGTGLSGGLCVGNGCTAILGGEIKATGQIVAGSGLVAAIDGVRSAPGAFSAVPICNNLNEGTTITITDSTTNTWGATISGSGSDVVLGFCDGTNYTVAAK